VPERWLGHESVTIDRGWDPRRGPSRPTVGVVVRIAERTVTKSAWHCRWPTSQIEAVRAFIHNYGPPRPSRCWSELSVGPVASDCMLCPTAARSADRGRCPRPALTASKELGAGQGDLGPRLGDYPDVRAPLSTDAGNSGRNREAMQ
jgi:hypothetical protein